MKEVIVISVTEIHKEPYINEYGKQKERIKTGTTHHVNEVMTVESKIEIVNHYKEKFKCADVFLHTQEKL
jgi:hypothetical protein